MKRFLHNVGERIKSRIQGRTGTTYEVTTDDAGVRVKWLTMENETGEVAFRWDAVTAVKTFKRDQFCVDCICLAFETPEGWIEVNEDMKPFGPFLEAVERNLPGFPPQKDWWVSEDMKMQPVIALAGLSEQFSHLQLMLGYVSLPFLLLSIVAAAIFWSKRVTTLALILTLLSAVISMPWSACYSITNPDLDKVLWYDRFASLGQVWIGCFVAACSIGVVLSTIRGWMYLKGHRTQQASRT